MKTFIIITFIIVQFTVRCVAGTSILPEIPAPHLSVPQVLSIFQQQMHQQTNYVIVSVDWYKSSTFQPRIGDIHYIPGTDHPEDYSWFITYIYKDEHTDKELKKMSVTRQFNEAGVERIKDDGQMGSFIGAR